MAETEAEIHGREEKEREEEETPTVVRIFVGGLGESVTDDDLRNIFSSSSRGLGKVETIEIIRTKGRSFAYMNFFPLSHNSLSRLFSAQYNGCVWKGGKLRLEKAKDDYLSRLKKEWDEDAQLASLSSEKAADQKLELPSLPTKDDLRDQKMVMFFPRLGKLKTLPLIGTGKHRYSFRRVDVPPLPKHFCDCEEHSHYVAVKKRNPDPEYGHDGLNEQEINLMNSVMNRLLQRESGGKPPVGGVDVKMAKEEHKKKEPAVEEHHPVDSHEALQVDDDSESDEDSIVLNIVSRKRKFSSSTNQEAKDSTSLIKEMKSLLNGENYVNESSQSAHQNSERSKSQLSLGTPIVETEKGIRGSNPSVAEKKRSSWRELVDNGSSSTFNISEVLPGLGSNKKKVRKSYDIAKSDQVENSEFQVDGSNNQFTISGVLTGAAPSIMDQSNSDDIVHTSSDKETSSGDEESESELSNTEVTGNCKPRASCISEALTNIDISSHKEEAKSDDDEKLSGDDNNELSEEEMSEDVENDGDVKKASTSDKTAGRGSAWRHKSSWTELVSGNNSSLFSISQILPGGDPEKQEPVVGEAVKVVSSTSSQVDDDKSSEPIQHLVVNQEERNVESCAEVGQIAEKNEECEEKVGLVRKQLVGETCSFMRSAASLKEWAKAKEARSRSRKKRKQ